MSKQMKMIMESFRRNIEEISKKQYEQIESNKRYVLSHEEEIKFDKNRCRPQDIDDKPSGLWYMVGTGWVDFINMEMPHWSSQDYLHEIEIDQSKLIVIRDEWQFEDFEDLYMEGKDINWPKVAQSHSGIEISPYLWSKRQRRWYHSWDVSSGCIWCPDAIKSIVPIPWPEEFGPEVPWKPWDKDENLPWDPPKNKSTR